MHLDFLLSVFRENAARPAMAAGGVVRDYGDLLKAFEDAREVLRRGNVARGRVVALEADYSPSAVAMLLAMMEEGCISVPLTPSEASKKDEYRQIAEVEAVVSPRSGEGWEIVSTGRAATHPLLKKLRDSGRPGLILFSSGSTGKSKGIVHDAAQLLEKYKRRRHSMRTITFMLFDHIGGVDTLLYTLSNAGLLIFLDKRTPDAVCEAIEKHRAQVLPATPTFLNLLLISGAHERRDLSSLEIVTYGTEVMPESTLRRFSTAFPKVRLLQKYGLSEVGTLRSKSLASDSPWVRIGGEGFRTRVVDGMLEIKAISAMLGYLNAPSPFTSDGWLKTGDAVEVNGDYIRILGRKSELINVGGEKVFPAEVEGVLQLMPGVEEAVVSGEPNPLLGHIIKASVRLTKPEDIQSFRVRMREFCKGKLPAYKIPQKVVFAEASATGERYKKIRKNPAP